MSENCYFFVEVDTEIVRCVCIKCHDDKMSLDDGWFYEGSEIGYGPFDYKCHFCEKMISRKEESELYFEEEEIETPD